MSLQPIIDQLNAELVAIDAHRAKVLGALALLVDAEPECVLPEPVAPVRVPEGAPVVAPKRSTPKPAKKATKRSTPKVQAMRSCPNGCGYESNGPGIYQHARGPKCPNRSGTTEPDPPRDIPRAQTIDVRQPSPIVASILEATRRPAGPSDPMERRPFDPERARLAAVEAL